MMMPQALNAGPTHVRLVPNKASTNSPRPVDHRHGSLRAVNSVRLQRVPAVLVDVAGTNSPDPQRKNEARPRESKLRRAAHIDDLFSRMHESSAPGRLSSRDDYSPHRCNVDKDAEEALSWYRDYVPQHVASGFEATATPMSMGRLPAPTVSIDATYSRQESISPSCNTSWTVAEPEPLFLRAKVPTAEAWSPGWPHSVTACPTPPLSLQPGLLYPDRTMASFPAQKRRSITSSHRSANYWAQTDDEDEGGESGTRPGRSLRARSSSIASSIRSRSSSIASVVRRYIRGQHAESRSRSRDSNRRSDSRGSVRAWWIGFRPSHRRHYDAGDTDEDTGQKEFVNMREGDERGRTRQRRRPPGPPISNARFWQKIEAKANVKKHLATAVQQPAEGNQRQNFSTDRCSLARSFNQGG